MAARANLAYCLARMGLKREKSLEIDHDDDFQRRSWAVQRIGWAFMVLVIVAALAGLLGPGPLFERELEGSTGLRIRYDRFVRYEAPASVHLELTASAEGEAHFWLEGAWLERVHVENVNPEPERVVANAERVHYAIAAEPKERVRVTIHFEADAVGALRGAIGQSNAPGLPLEQFAYP
jgi:hypothetical protein